MKKIIIYVSCLLFALSCSDYEEQLRSVTGEDINNEISSLRSGGDGNYDVLGYGYDITGAYLHPTSVKNTVIDIKRLENDYPGLIYFDGSGYGATKYTYGYNAEGYLSELTKEVPDKFKADFALVKDLKLFSGTFLNSNNFKSDFPYSSLYMFASCDVSIYIKRLYLSANADVNLLKDYLSPSFAQDLNTKSAEEIIETYGTHVLTDFTIGGRINFMFRSTANASMTNAIRKEVVKAGANFAFTKIVGIVPDASVSQETINRYKDDNKSEGLNIVWYGGESGYRSYNPETGYTTVDIMAWAKTVNKNNAALTEINWDKAIPIWEFASNPTQSEALKAAAINHVENNMIHCVELLPLIGYYYGGSTTNYVFYGGDTNSPYFGTLYSLGAYYPVSSHLAGYMLRDQEEGTKPLYVFQKKAPYNQAEKFLYTTDRNIQTDYLYLGFLGYVYTEQIPGTSKPVPMQNYPLDFEGESFYVYTPN